MTWEENVELLTSLVQGELFCNMENAWWDIETCQEEWAWTMPRIMETLGQWFGNDEWMMRFCGQVMGVC